MSASLGKTDDRYFAEHTGALVIDSFRIYVDIGRKWYQKDRAAGTTDRKIVRVKEGSGLFSVQGDYIFAKFQPADMGTLKWHIITDLCDDCKERGCVQYPDDGL